MIDSKKEMKGIKFEVPALKRRELRFPIETENCGIGTFRIAIQVEFSKFSDSSEVKVPVYTPSTTEGFATYGEIDEKKELVI
jgi:alpha-2-macroglobulin